MSIEHECMYYIICIIFLQQTVEKLKINSLENFRQAFSVYKAQPGPGPVSERPILRQKKCFYPETLKI